jgi:hypothetical protein
LEGLGHKTKIKGIKQRGLFLLQPLYTIFYLYIMLLIDQTRISEELIKKAFVCDLSACKGACCVAGASGAPLEANEADALKKDFNKIKPYMVAQGISAVKKQGYAVYDSDGDLTTPLVGPEKECAYVYFDADQTAKCAIEKAYTEGKLSWNKPLSCHLYPIRINRNKEIEVLKYSRWSVCAPACENGARLKVPVYKFLKAPLIRKFGVQWFKKLDELASRYLQSQIK